MRRGRDVNLVGPARVTGNVGGEPVVGKEQSFAGLAFRGDQGALQALRVAPKMGAAGS